MASTYCGPAPRPARASTTGARNLKPRLVLWTILVVEANAHPLHYLFSHAWFAVLLVELAAPALLLKVSRDVNGWEWRLCRWAVHTTIEVAADTRTGLAKLRQYIRQRRKA
jgi:hypothetical protein